MHPEASDDIRVQSTPEDDERDATGRPAPAVLPSVDAMGESSFPASDPPATWTWDVEVGRSR